MQLIAVFHSIKHGSAAQRMVVRGGGINAHGNILRGVTLLRCSHQPIYICGIIYHSGHEIGWAYLSDQPVTNAVVDDDAEKQLPIEPQVPKNTLRRCALKLGIASI